MSTFQEIVMHVCLYGLIACGVALFAAKVLAPAWCQIRKFFSLPRIQQIVLIPCIVGLVFYGSTKQGWHITWDGGIKDLGRSLVTNDTIHIEWQRDTSHGVYVPGSAAVYIDYRPNTETNAEFGLLAQSTVGAWEWNGTLADATNYDYNVWAYYIPPEPVHTNGVWVYKTLKDRNDKYAIPLRARIQINGKAIATPAEKRKDEK